MRPSENWLLSDDHDKFAAAAIECQHAGGYCISDGFCHLGNCFGQADAKWKQQQISELRINAAEFGYILVKHK